MPDTVADFLGDGDAVENRGPAVIMAKPQTKNVRVAREGVMVLFEIGPDKMRFDYRDAILIGQWLQVKGFEAKCLDDNREQIILDPAQSRT